MLVDFLRAEACRDRMVGFVGYKGTIIGILQD